MRIASLSPSATETLVTIGAADLLVGVSHRCEQPPGVELPELTSARIDPDLPPLLAEEQARHARSRGQSLTVVDAEAVAAARPDVVICETPPDAAAVRDAASAAGLELEVVELEPTTLAEVLACIERLGTVSGRAEQARALTASLKERIAAVHSAVGSFTPLPTLVLEWTEPAYCAGHWVPDVVAAAGGREILGISGRASERVTWENASAPDPAVVLVSPAGYRLKRAGEAARGLLPRFPKADVWALDGDRLLGRPGPGLVDAIELIAWILFPDDVPRPERMERMAKRLQ